MNGFIKLHRSLLDWGWYRDANTKAVFLHLLLTANWEPSDFLGQWVDRGQAVFGMQSMADKLGMSLQNVRTALAHLKSTGEITIRPTRLFSIATIVKYNEYQERCDPANIPGNTGSNNEMTSNQHRANNEATPSKNRRNKETNKSAGRDGAAAGLGARRPPNYDRYKGTEWDMSTWNTGGLDARLPSNRQ